MKDRTEDYEQQKRYLELQLKSSEDKMIWIKKEKEALEEMKLGLLKEMKSCKNKFDHELLKVFIIYTTIF